MNFLISFKINTKCLSNYKEFFDHVHTIENNPIMIHSKLNRELTVNLREMIAMYIRGIHLIFPDIDYIQAKMEELLNAR